MSSKNFVKYKAYQPLVMPDRRWPNRTVTQAPIWCSVDLRDGNQALILPMNLEEKIELFNLLVKIGFKHIEVGFPSASEVEFQFLRTLIEKNLIPDDVTVQVLTQAREHLIRRTFEALSGVKRAIVHLYNSTSTVQREVVFGMSRIQIKQLAVDGVKLIKSLIQETKTTITLEYSPESFTGTEIDYAIEVCEAVMDVWQPTVENKIILNLPATVEMSTPNIYADLIEYFSSHLKNRECAIVSLHCHNDRGTAVAATELGLMAGGDRVEGTLFGNGERTGNVDLVTVALNLFTQGIDPKLDFSQINNVIEVSQRVTKIRVHERHPYAGELVYTAFSGSHQDAIKKGINKRLEQNRPYWDVPYLPIDPSDVGRSYEAIIRINSQSGKGGVAYVMETDYGCSLPKAMHPEFASVIQKIAEVTGKDVPNSEIWQAFEKTYLEAGQPFDFVNFESYPNLQDKEITDCKLEVSLNGKTLELLGSGNGPIDACKDALMREELANFKLLNYSEHALNEGSSSKAIAYIQIENLKNGQVCFGAGIHHNINKASVKALLSAINRSMQEQSVKNKETVKLVR